MERLWTFYVSISHGIIKWPAEKWIFAINLDLKLFLAIVANVNIGSLKSLPIIKTVLKSCKNYQQYKTIRKKK